MSDTIDRYESLNIKHLGEVRKVCPSTSSNALIKDTKKMARDGTRVDARAVLPMDLTLELEPEASRCDAKVPAQCGRNALFWLHSAF